MIEISVKDQVTPMINRYLAQNPKFMRALTKSLGWYVSGRIKRLINTKKFQTVANWRERIPLDVRRKLNPQEPKEWYGQMRRAIGYQYADNAVNIGWTSLTSAIYGRIQEFGITRTITPNIRRYFGEHGVHLKWNTNQLKVPARPLFNPVMPLIEPGIEEHVEKQVRKYILEGVPENSKPTRKYEVYK